MHAWLASTYALKGETARAAAELAEARRLSGDDRYSSIARMRAMEIGPSLKSASCSKRPITPGCARPECRTSEDTVAVTTLNDPEHVGAKRGNARG
jgi:hypothetical protein